MEKLSQIIKEITKYGLNPDLVLENKEQDLEQYLIALYSHSFHLQYQFDNASYPTFDKSYFPSVIENIQKHFPNFGFYHIVLNKHDSLKAAEIGMGDAIDDLADIIYDLLEVQWRMENNSVADGLWYFEWIFKNHTQQHLLDLLNFMKSKNG